MKSFFTSCLTLLFFTTLSAYAQTDTTKSVFEKGLDQIQLNKAKHLLYNYDYSGALAAYEALYADNQNNPMVLYRIGETNFKLKNYKPALEFLEKAVKVAPEVDKDARLMYAEALHMNSKFEDAIAQLELYKKGLKEKQIPAIDSKIKGLRFAMATLEKPLNVKIENMGADINSNFEDYGPSISSDEKTLIFTSRRPDTKGGDTDVDGKYFEDIYISSWDEENGKFNKAEPIKGRLNTEYHDACLSISPDGKLIYVYKNFGENGSGEIYVSKLSSSAKWGAPKALDKMINTSYFESSASVTSDGQKMYFLSERKGGLGMADIWVAERISKSEWSEPVNIGGVINTEFDERMVFIHPEGNILFFASDGHVENSIGGYDIYMSEFKDDAWQKPINLGAPINSVNDDVNFVLSFDAKTAYYSGVKDPSFGARDIYKLDVSEHKEIKRVREMYVAISGEIVDGLNNNEALKSKPTLTVKNADSQKVVKSMKLSTKEYAFKLEKGSKYTVEVKVSGYKTQTVNLDLSSSKEESVTQNFTMTR